MNHDKAFRAYLYENRISPTPQFSAGIDAACKRILRSGEPVRTKCETPGRMPQKRRALVILIAAILLLLSACAAYAIYWSSTQRAKDDAVAEINKPVDDLQREAEAYADAYVRDSGLTATLSGEASVGGVTLQMHSVDIFQDVDGAEYVFHYNVASATVGMVTSFGKAFLSGDQGAQERLRQYDRFCELGMDAKDFVLTIDGQTFPVYSQPDYDGEPQPASDWSAPTGERPYTSSIMVRANPFPITQDARMNLSGTLYACDSAGSRMGAIDSFSIDFAYRYPMEAAEEKRRQAIMRHLESHQASNENRLGALDELPENATPIGYTQDAYTLMDVAVLEDGFLFGTKTDRQWAAENGFEGTNIVKLPDPYIYLDGYLQDIDLLDMIWEVDETKPKDAVDGYPVKTVTSLTKVFYYRPYDEMPELVTVYLKRQPHEWYDNDTRAISVDESCLPLATALKINRTTGAVVLPKDAAEEQAWVAEQERLATDGRNDVRDYEIHQAQTVNGKTVVLERLLYDPKSGQITIYAFMPHMVCELMALETNPLVTLNGITPECPRISAYYLAHDASLREREQYQVNVEEWVRTYGGNTDRFIWDDRWYQAPERFTELPETFTLTWEYDLYDLNDKAERVFIGHYAFAAQLRRDGYTAFHREDRGYRNDWMRTVMDE